VFYEPLAFYRSECAERDWMGCGGRKISIGLRQRHPGARLECSKRQGLDRQVGELLPSGLKRPVRS